MNIRPAPTGETRFLIGGNDWNAMRDAALQGGRFAVAGPLELRKDASGVTLVCTAGDGAPTPIIVKGPATDDAAGAGVFIGHIIDGPIDNEKTGDLSPQHFGTVPEEPETEEQDEGEGEDEEAPAPEEVELWNTTGADLVIGGEVAGWHIGNRPDSMGGRRVFMVTYSPVVVTVMVSAYAAGGGKYILKLVQPGTADVSESDTLSEAEIGEAYTPSDSTIKYLGLNLPEVGQDTHILEVGRMCRGTIRRRQTNGVIVVHIEAYGFEDDCESATGGE